MTRADVLKRGAAAGAGIYGLSALFGAGTALAGMEARALTPTFYQWIYGLYPDIPSKINKDYAKTHKLDAKIAPVQGFGIDRFVAEAKKKKSTWDVYVGMTPFVEMAALIESGTIEPWDKYIPKSVLADLIPSIRAEATYQGHIWSFPFLLDIIIQAWNGELVEEGGPRPEQGAEDVGRVHRQREEGRQLEGGAVRCRVRRARLALARADRAHVQHERLHAGRAVRLHERRGRERPRDHEAADGGRAEEHPRGGQGRRRRQHDARRGSVRRTPGGLLRQVPERADALRRHVARPEVLHIAGLPKARSGGGTVFWNTGAALFKYGQNKQQAADYMEFLTRDVRIWQHALGKDVRGASGQLSPYRSDWAKWTKNPPSWMADWAFTVRKELATSKAIRTHKFGLTQFVIGKPAWEAYLKGDEKNAKKALAKAKALVLAEVKKSR